MKSPKSAHERTELIWLLVVIVVLAGQVSCNGKRQNQRISGQIFTALSSRETIRLSAVPVSISERQVAKEHFTRLLRLWKNEVQTNRNELEVIDQREQIVKTELDTAELKKSALLQRPAFKNLLEAKAGYEAWKKIPDATPLAPQEKMRREAYERRTWIEPIAQLEAQCDLSELERLEEIINQRQRELSTLSNERLKTLERREASRLARYLASARLPTVVASRTSDADGRFSFNLPRGNYVVLASCSRETLGRKEEFFWLVETMGQDPDQLLLNNANLLTEESMADFLLRQ